jgi:predicted CoA-binding protein
VGFRQGAFFGAASSFCLKIVVKGGSMKDLKSKRIAVVGVSDNPEKYGYRIFQDFLRSGYSVEGVNPKGGELIGRKIFKNLKEIENKPDIVVTVVPPAVTEKVVEECHAQGINEIWMQPGSESTAAIDKAKGYGMAVTYNACIMMQNDIW